MKKLAYALLASCLLAGGAHAEGYVVQRGDYLIKIAKERDVAWQSLLFANEKELKEKYEATCGLLRKRYTHSPTRRGHYCNAKKHHAYGNTLKKGWSLRIPAKAATTEVEATIAAIKGKRVAVVIDDTGSMQSNRQAAGELYFAALRQFGKQIVGVFLYADGDVREYTPEGVEFRRSGARENTHGALIHALRSKPDHIVLISDEQGDDWDWSRVRELPPVTAHCLPPDPRYRGCEETLARLAKETGGQYKAPR